MDEFYKFVGMTTMSILISILARSIHDRLRLTAKRNNKKSGR